MIKIFLSPYKERKKNSVTIYSFQLDSVHLYLHTPSWQKITHYVQNFNRASLNISHLLYFSYVCSNKNQEKYVLFCFFFFKAGLLYTIITIFTTTLMNMLKYQCNFQWECAKIANNLVLPQSNLVPLQVSG